jgi:hypothetical protein
MPVARCSEDQFIALMGALGSPSLVAKHLNVSVRNVHERRRAIEERRGVDLSTTYDTRLRGAQEPVRDFCQRRNVEIVNGSVVVFSDAHYWPGDPSLAHIALCRVAAQVKPALIIGNGDVLDGASISRHEPRGWKGCPNVGEEVAVLKERLGEVRAAAPKARTLRTLGNHCIRFERWLATRAPEFRGLTGTTLEDHIPDWPCSWSVWVNNTVVIKHRWAGGTHATYNNTLKSGKTVVTGHLHALNVRAFTDYNGVRWGVDTGTLADTDHDAFDYTEDNPKDWRSGFAVLTFRDSKLLWPELAYVDHEKCWFRGEAIA